MKINSQRLAFKISPMDHRYSRRVEENLAASNTTFSDVQTPGWSSLMKSQISDRTRRTFQDKDEGSGEANIYAKLSQTKELKWDSRAERKMMKTKVNPNQSDTRDTQNERRFSTVEKKDNKLKENPAIPKRFNQISVHEHLYKNSFKLENKKIINKILDEKMKRKQIYPFTPSINPKSVILAESKFTRAKQNQDLFRKNDNTLQTEASEIKDKDDKDVERYKLLNKIFYFLSQNQTILNEENLQNTLEKIPMHCITVIQPIVQKVYQGTQMEWLDFLQHFNDKKVKGKEGFYSIISKWLQRQDKCEKENNIEE